MANPEVSSADRRAADSVHERMFLAVTALCTGEGEVRTRLLYAGLHLLPLMKSEFPIELQEDYDWVIKELTRFPGEKEGEGRIEGTLRHIDGETGVRMAQRIFRMYLRVEELRIENPRQT